MSLDTIVKGGNSTYHYPMLSAVLALICIMMIPFLPSVFAYIPFFIFVVRAVKYGMKTVIVDVMLVVPFGSIYKTPSGVGFIEYYLIICELSYLYNNARRVRKEILAVICLIVFLFVRADGKLGSFVCISVGITFLFVFEDILQHDVARICCMIYPAALIVSSIYAMVFARNANVQAYLCDPEQLVGNLGGYRFQGLFLDPNYYAVYLLIAIFMLFSSIIYTKGHKLLIGVLLILSVYFGLITYSRMYYLTLAMFLVVWIAASIKAKKYRAVGITILIAILGVVYVYYVNSDILYNITLRFSTSDVTSGRSALYQAYWDAITQNIGKALFGYGLAAPLVNGHGSHNLFLEISYYVGVPFLFVLLCYFVDVCWHVSGKFSSTKRITQYYAFGGLAILMFMFCSLQGFSSTSFYVLIALLLCGSVLPQ